MQCTMQGTVVSLTPQTKRSVQETQVMWHWLQQMAKMLSATRKNTMNQTPVSSTLTLAIKGNPREVPFRRSMLPFSWSSTSEPHSTRSKAYVIRAEPLSFTRLDALRDTVHHLIKSALLTHDHFAAQPASHLITWGPGTHGVPLNKTAPRPISI